MWRKAPEGDGVGLPVRRKTEIANDELEVRILDRLEDRPRKPARRMQRRCASERGRHFGRRGEQATAFARKLWLLAGAMPTDAAIPMTKAKPDSKTR
jgi:hypothetical protein